MPTYTYKCPKCNNISDKNVLIKLRNNQICIECSVPLERIWENPKTNITIDKTLGYYDIQLGHYINSTSDRRRIMNQLGVEGISPGTDRSQFKPKQKSTDYKQVLTENMKRLKGY